jgi:hypothetical protein
MEVEFWRGPIDGVRQEIPDGTKLWIVRAPRADGDVKQFRVPADAPAPDVVVAVDEHAYAITDRVGIASGLRIFEYVGERVKK